MIFLKTMRMEKEMEKEIVRLGREDYDAIVALWEVSVLATHSFLKESDREHIKHRMKSMYLPFVDLYGIRQGDRLAAFMGENAKKVEMLFVDPLFFGQGYGKRLLRYAVDGLRAVLVDVNEQNEKALAFYLHAGFRVLSRDATDGDGKDYPILHLEWAGEKTE